MDVDWIITEPVEVKADYLPDDDGVVRVLVRSMPDAAGSYRECALRFDGNDLTFNTVRVEVNDDFIAYVSLMDEACDSKPGEWVRSEPYRDGGELWTW